MANDQPQPRNADRAAASDVCPYCGGETPDRPAKCPSCGGGLDPLSRQATQNQLGPWFVRDAMQPFLPGCSLATLQRLVRTGRVTPDTVIRGPSTGQFWRRATSVPGVARLFGVCHSCGEGVTADQHVCQMCGAVLDVNDDRQVLGLGAVRPLGEPTAPPPTTPPPTTPPPNAAPRATPPPQNQPHQGVGAALLSPRSRVRRRARGAGWSLVILIGGAVAVVAMVAGRLSSGGGGPASAGAEPASADPGPETAPERERASDAHQARARAAEAEPETANTGVPTSRVPTSESVDPWARLRSVLATRPPDARPAALDALVTEAGGPEVVAAAVADRAARAALRRIP